MRATQGHVHIVHHHGGVVEQLVQRVSPPDIRRVGEPSLTAKIAALTVLNAVTGPVVLMHMRCAAHTQVCPTDESATCIAEVNLRLDRDLHGDMEGPQHGFATGLCPLVGCPVGTSQHPYAGTATLQQALHHGAVDVTQGQGRIEHDNKVKMSEVTRTAQQDLFGRIDRQALHRRGSPGTVFRRDDKARTQQTRATHTIDLSMDRREHRDLLWQRRKAPASEPGRSDMCEHRAFGEYTQPCAQVSSELLVVAEVWPVGQVQPVADPTESRQPDLTADWLVIARHTGQPSAYPPTPAVRDGTPVDNRV